MVEYFPEVVEPVFYGAPEEVKSPQTGDVEEEQEEDPNKINLEDFVLLKTISEAITPSKLSPANNISNKCNFWLHHFRISKLYKKVILVSKT